MALSKNLEVSPLGVSTSVVVENAYFKITDIKGGKKAITVSVKGYENSEASVSFYENSFVFQPALEGSNFIAQAYEHLKTLPEFADAVDC